MGAILSQKQDDDKWHPVAYMSHSMDGAQRNYHIYDKELMAVVEALKEWEHFLKGAKHKVDVLTDHHNLQYFRTARDLSHRQRRWALYMEIFKLQLKHRPRRLSGKPDALSQHTNHDKGLDDGKDQILLGDKLFKKIDIIKLRSQFDLDIHEDQLRNPLIIDLMMKKEKDKVAGWDCNNGLWKFHGKIYVPENLRRDVFNSHHSSPVAGHPGIKGMIEAIGRTYYWPSLRQDVEQRVRFCDSCQHVKPATGKPPGKLQPNEIPSYPWEIVSRDFITGLPESQGYNAILVVVDHFSKMVILIPCTSSLDSLGTTHLMRDHVWAHYGMPRIMISDRGPQFASNFTRELSKTLGIKLAFSSAYHPQSDGQTE